MTSESNKAEWYYLAGVEVRGPVALEQVAALVQARALPENVMVSTKTTPQWRPFHQAVNGSSPEQNPVPGATSRGSTSLARDLLDRVGETLNSVASTEKLEGFSLAEIFSETFQKRSATEMEDYLIVGTHRTTPPISQVQTGWPKPWLFMRFMIFFGLIYFGFVFAFKQFHNDKLIPGIILMGTFASPLATLILFFELNTPRNVSVYRLLMLMALGGIVSMLVSLFGFAFAPLDRLGPPAAGIVEELGKLATLMLLVRGSRYKYILNGMLFGAAVGAGFAAFESAGYALSTRDVFVSYYGSDAGSYPGSNFMMEIIVVRAMLAPLMHVAWTAMVGAALWRVKGDQPVSMSMLLDPRFYRVLLLAMFLHMFWNTFWHPPLYLKELALGAAAWFVIWGLVQQGLHQVSDEQRVAAGAEQANGTQHVPDHI